MIQFKAKFDTLPKKLASAIAHNIDNNDIAVTCVGAEAVNNTVKALIVAEEFTRNRRYNLKFKFHQLQDVSDDGKTYNYIKIVVSKDYS